MSREDAIPKWALEILPDHGEDGSRSVRQSSGNPDQTWEHSKLELIHKCVCEPCNTGWMSDLEGAAKPFLESMILGRGRELHETGRRLAATWAVKTALVLQGPDPKSTIPAEHYREVRELGSLPKQEPPKGVQVWLAAYDFARDDFLHRHDGLRLTGTDLDVPPKSYGATFNIGHLAFQVFWSELDPPAKRNIGNNLVPYLREIWPAQSMVAWPPPNVLDLDGLKLLAIESFISGPRKASR
jgi:hypothetical protein